MEGGYVNTELYAYVKHKDNSSLYDSHMIELSINPKDAEWYYKYIMARSKDISNAISLKIESAHKLIYDDERKDIKDAISNRKKKSIHQ